jgi:hypothetical protein
MARNVRNVWVEADIDGRETTLEGGPVNRHGGMTMRVYIRDGGHIATAVRISAQAGPDGQITLYVTPSDEIKANVIGRGTGRGFTIVTNRDRKLSRRDVLASDR